jgi:hypothetical protein
MNAQQVLQQALATQIPKDVVQACITPIKI